ncbi:unnamed protein product [Danaus chrysippus]|uniref:(African queen) hypothetical protein n=1 Tax=Danaus chrysippus TaxID=151541 RepID=A0A8J2QJA3_9NEOP|nr:unnamed protein product [Danaus chrysippus]
MSSRRHQGGSIRPHCSRGGCAAPPPATDPPLHGVPPPAARAPLSPPPSPCTQNSPYLIPNSAKQFLLQRCKV